MICSWANLPCLSAHKLVHVLSTWTKVKLWGHSPSCCISQVAQTWRISWSLCSMQKRPQYDKEKRYSAPHKSHSSINSRNIYLPSLTCDPTTVKDLKRTPAKVSLSALHKQWKLLKCTKIIKISHVQATRQLLHWNQPSITLSLSIPSKHSVRNASPTERNTLLPIVCHVLLTTICTASDVRVF
jgi:hypothetical protein